MPSSDAQNKTDRHFLLRRLFDQPGRRLRTGEIADRLGVSEDTAKRDINELSANGRLPLRKEGQFWMLAEDARLEPLHVRLDFAEATSLYVAGRLLSQIHDEQNRHVIMALTKLTDALPTQLRTHQRALIEIAQQRSQSQEDRSAIFEALTIGWATRRKVRLFYAPPRKRKFECLFAPYLLEPSGIGRTIYVLGESSLDGQLGQLRTFKLERIESAEVTKEPFEVDSNFDGPAKLQRAWGVMFGEDEEPTTVRLRFSLYVTKRVKETLWHPTQKIQDTPDGCIFTVQIGDTLEIENWIRGWGSDCEVLEPAALRERMVADLRRSVRTYGIMSVATNTTDDDDDDLLASF